MLVKIERDFSAGIANAYDEHAAACIRTAVAIITAVHHRPAATLLPRPLRHDRLAIEPRRDDQMARAVRRGARLHVPSAVATARGDDLFIESRLESEGTGVRLEIFDHLIARRISWTATREGKEWKRRTSLVRVKVQPIVMCSPGRGYSSPSFEDGKWNVRARQTRTHREASGARADHDRGVIACQAAASPRTAAVSISTRRVPS